MNPQRISRGVLAGVMVLVLTGLFWSRSDRPLSAQTAQQLPSVEERLTAWTAARGTEKVPASVSFGKLLPDAQIEQLVRRYELQPYAVFMWSEGMSGAHRTIPSKAAVGVLAEARQSTISMKQKAKESNRSRSRKFVQDNPQDKVQGNRSLEQDAKSLLRAAEQNDKILNAAQSGAPLIYGIEVLGSADQLRKLAQDPAVTGVQPAVIAEGRVLVPPVTEPAETRGQYRSPAIDALSSADTYNRVQQAAGTEVKGRTR